MSDHYLGMLDMKRDVGNATRDQLIACLLELLDEPEVKHSTHLLALIMRHVDQSCIRYQNRMAQMKMPAPEPAEPCTAEHYVDWPSDRNLPCVHTGEHDQHRDILGFTWDKD